MTTKEKLYKVEQILDLRYNAETNKPQYLVKWKGWSKKFNTWEPYQNMKSCQEYVDQFHAEYAQKMIEKSDCDSTNVKIFEEVQQEVVYRVVEQINHFRIRLENYRDEMVRSKLVGNLVENQKIIICEPIRCKYLEEEDWSFHQSNRNEETRSSNPADSFILDLNKLTHFRPCSFSLDSLQKQKISCQIDKAAVQLTLSSLKQDKQGKITDQKPQIEKMVQTNKANPSEDQKPISINDSCFKISRLQRLKSFLAKRNVEVKEMTKEKGKYYYLLGYRNKPEVIIEATREELIQMNQNLLLKYFKKRIIDNV